MKSLERQMEDERKMKDGGRIEYGYLRKTKLMNQVFGEWKLVMEV